MTNRLHPSEDLMTQVPDVHASSLQTAYNLTMPLTPNDIEQFRRIYLFSGLTDQELARVAAHASFRELAAGDILFRLGDACNHFFLVQTGVMKLYRLSQSGEEKVIELISPDQLFAEAVMFMGARYPVYAQAVEPVRLIVFDSQDFSDLLHSNTELCFRLMAAMSRRMHGLINEIDRLTLHSGTQRLIQYLLDQLPEGVAPSHSIHLRVPKLVIASRLGIQPETLSRILSKLRQEGLLEISEETILLRDVAALRGLT